MPYLSASVVVFHYEEALYQVYAPLPFTIYVSAVRVNPHLRGIEFCPPAPLETLSPKWSGQRRDCKMGTDGDRVRRKWIDDCKR